jgi:hypothetical protein
MEERRRLKRSVGNKGGVSRLTGPGGRVLELASE